MTERELDLILVLALVATLGNVACREGATSGVVMPTDTRPGTVIRLKATPTLAPVQMDLGDTLEFTVANGQTRTLKLLKTQAKILWSNVEDLRKSGEAEVHDDSGCFLAGRTLYHFTAEVLIDGLPMTLERFVSSQESFYEPYVVNGMRIWFDAVSDIFADDGGFLNEKHGPCKPGKKARFAVQDMTLPLCPQPLHSWYPDDENFIDVERCFSGDDPWLGAFLGEDAHGGLDVNMAYGSPHWAPIDCDSQGLVLDRARGDFNNRWQGIRAWPDGSRWALQVSHVIKATLPEGSPAKAGEQVAEGAGVRCWWHDHAHFCFNVAKEGDWIRLDPWIIMWGIFERKKAEAGRIKASMAPLSPAKTGQDVAFDGSASRPGEHAGRLRYFWTFGDGGSAQSAKATHAFAQAGVYPVTLTVSNNERTAAFTQHITVNGPDVEQPAMRLAAPDEPAFRSRPVRAMDVYGRPAAEPHVLGFLARPTRPRPDAKSILLQNACSGTLGAASVRVEYEAGEGWLAVEQAGQDNQQSLSVSVDAEGLESGEYTATVRVSMPDVLNGEQVFRARLTVPSAAPAENVTVDDRDPGCYATPYFWVGHRFHGYGWPKRGEWMVRQYDPAWEDIETGLRSFHLTNGGRVAEGEFVRFTPDLAAGRYRVRLHESTPFDPASSFFVRVRHKDGVDMVRVTPAESREIGAFEFDEGADGFVEILAARSTGQVVADAVVFARLRG